MIDRLIVGNVYSRSTYLPRTKQTEPIGVERLSLVVSSRWTAGLGFLKANSMVVANFATVAAD